MTAAIKLEGLSKTYAGVRALDEVDLTVPEGSVFGFLGPNGAGKTTTLRILSGLAHATSGTARIFGMDAGSSRASAVVGFLPDVPGFYEWMTAPEYLRFCGGLFGIDRDTVEARSAALLDMAGLAGVTTRVGGFSRGMKQRLGVAQALVNAPRLLMLDEPTSALDPLGRRDVLDMIVALRGKTTVFFSTHILADVERVCDTVAVLDRGRVVVQAPIGDLTARGTRRFVLEVDGDVEPVAGELERAGWVSAVTREPGRVTFGATDSAVVGREIPAMLASHRLGIIRFEPVEVTLEDVFVGLVSGDSGAESGIAEVRQ